MPKKIPLRQCLGCREMKPKGELIRVVRSPQGEISLDFHGKKPGRGAYLCPDPACLKKVRGGASRGGLPGAQSVPAAAGLRRRGQHHPPGSPVHPSRKDHTPDPTPG